MITKQQAKDAVEKAISDYSACGGDIEMGEAIRRAQAAIDAIPEPTDEK